MNFLIWPFYFLSFNGGLGGAYILSPYVLVSFFFFFLSFILFIAQQIHVSMKRQTLFFAITFLTACFLTYFLNSEPLVVLMRNVFLLASLSVVRFIGNQGKRILNLFFVLLTFELIFRMLGKVGNLSFNFYTYKQSLIFPDTNFLGLVSLSLLPLIIIRSNWLYSTTFYSVVLLSFSRTAWLTLTLGRLFFRYRIILSLLSALFFIVPIFSVSILIEYLDVDGSLLTKFDILRGFLLITSDLKYLFFGVGKDYAIDFVLDKSGENLHVGHTIYGNFVQYGALLVLSYIFLARSLISVELRPFFTFVIFISGCTGLFPFAYIPMIVLLFNCYNVGYNR